MGEVILDIEGSDHCLQPDPYVKTVYARLKLDMVNGKTCDLFHVDSSLSYMYGAHNKLHT